MSAIGGALVYTRAVLQRRELEAGELRRMHFRLVWEAEEADDPRSRAWYRERAERVRVRLDRVLEAIAALRIAAKGFSEMEAGR